ncbi:MAG: class I SAM-dependent methyltransferase [Proteobacteria bacterium]|nr:class I SAM-dependent methyltransferase [Pseudomonadota bacterium]
MEIKRCRVCGNENLQEILSLGNFAYTGVFPRRNENVPMGLLRLVKCEGDFEKACGIVQLRDSFDLTLLYGDNYGYRSSLNISMVNHLKDIVDDIKKTVSLNRGDIIVDIGSNDGTLLSFYDDGYSLIGIDPTAKKFLGFYKKDIVVISDFFSKRLFLDYFGSKKAKVITSIAMFYDLEDPVRFVRDISDILTDDGIWVFEQSYTPNIFKKCGYDTICHEHLLYYSLKDILFILEKAGMKIINIKLNNVNGASIRITASKLESQYNPALKKIGGILRYEEKIGYNRQNFWEDFRKRVFEHKEKLNDFIDRELGNGKKIFGYGASTKGNVILQFCGIDSVKIPYIAEVNEDKFGAFTPGTKIPIISEESARKMAPDYFLVLPWHFKRGIINKEKDFLKKGGKLIFPLPDLEVVNG